MVTDSVADALIRIKNGYLARRKTVELSYSKLVVAICQVLTKEGYIEKCEEISNEKSSLKSLVVTLKYEQKTPAMSDVKRVSKPGLRVYKGAKSLPYVLNGLGITKLDIRTVKN